MRRSALLKRRRPYEAPAGAPPAAPIEEPIDDEPAEVPSPVEETAEPAVGAEPPAEPAVEPAPAPAPPAAEPPSPSEGGCATNAQRRRLIQPPTDEGRPPRALALCGLAKSEAEALCGAAAFLGHTKVYAIGESIADDVSHVVMPAATKTLPLRGYFAAARGLWCVEPAWVFSSLERGSWLPERDYEVVPLDGVREARLARASGGWSGALSGVSVCIYGKTHLPSRTLQKLVSAAGGTVSASHRSCDVLVAEEPQHRPKHGGSRGEVRVRTPKWIFETICPSSSAGNADGADADTDAAPRRAEAGQEEADPSHPQPPPPAPAQDGGADGKDGSESDDSGTSEEF